MYAAHITFPNGFLGEMEFILSGNTLEDLIMDFCDVQDLDMHIENIRSHFSLKDHEKWDFSEEFYDRVINGEPISEEEFKQFMELDEAVCRMTDFLNAEDANLILHKKFPKAMYRNRL